MQLDRPMIMELVGPAGAGKSTLAHLLCQGDKGIHKAADFEMRKVKHVPHFVRNLPFLASVVLRRCADHPGYTWEQIKFLVYLKSWESILKHPSLGHHTAILLDQGPIYKLATLRIFSPVCSNGAGHWYQDIIQRWSNTLDLIVWLDAPDPVLKERIDRRGKQHIVKKTSEQVVFKFLEHYRSSYDQVLAELIKNGKPAVLRYDTSQVSIEQIADLLLNSGPKDRFPSNHRSLQPAMFLGNKNY